MEEEMIKHGDVLLYQNGSDKEVVSVVFHEETFWLPQSGMAELFDTSKQNISLHLKNCFGEDELEENSVVKEFLTTAADGKILKSDTLVAKNYLNEKELSRLNRLVTMFIDYAELMAEDEQLMSMEDWLKETDRFLTNNRRNVLEGKGRISHDAAVKKVGDIYAQFRKKQDADYISDFDRETVKYLKGLD